MKETMKKFGAWLLAAALAFAGATANADAVKTTDEFKTAIANAKSGDVITLAAGEFDASDGEAFGPLANKKVTIKGSGQDPVTGTKLLWGTGRKNASGAELTFENLYIDIASTPSGAYQFEQNFNAIGVETYRNVTFKGAMCTQNTAVFDSCTFVGPQTEALDEYLYWQYRGTATMTDCKFLASGPKGPIKLYAATGNTWKFSMSGCSFADEGTKGGVIYAVSNDYNNDDSKTPVVCEIYFGEGNTVANGGNVLKVKIMDTSWRSVIAVNPKKDESGKYVAGSFYVVKDETKATAALTGVFASDVEIPEIVNGQVVVEGGEEPKYAAYIGTTGYDTIQAAVDAANVQAGPVTITIMGGVHEETIYLNRENLKFSQDVNGKGVYGKVTFQAAEGADVTLNGYFSGGNGAGSFTDIKISGLKITTANEQGVYLEVSEFARNIEVSDCVITSTAWGVYINGPSMSNLKVQGCTINGAATWGVSLGGINNQHSNIAVIGNTFQNGSRGPALFGAVENASVTGNAFSGCKYALWLNNGSGIAKLQTPIAYANNAVNGEGVCAIAMAGLHSVDVAIGEGNTYNGENIIGWANPKEDGILIKDVYSVYYNHKLYFDGETAFATLADAVAADTSGDPLTIVNYDSSMEAPEGWEFKTEGGVTKLVKKVSAVAKVIAADGTETGYPTLAAAVAAVEDGQTIKLLTNLGTGSETFSLGGCATTDNPSITLDLGGFTIFGKVEGGGCAANTKYTMTIKNGTLDGYGVSGCVAIHPSGSKNGLNSKIILEDVALFGRIDVAYADVEIKSGVYTISAEKAATVDNFYDWYGALFAYADWYGGSAKIFGGKFDARYVEPTEVAVPFEDYLATGYTLEGPDADGFYTVVSGESNFAAEIVGGEKYKTVEAAFAAAENGDTVKLLKDVGSITLEPAVAGRIWIDLGGRAVCSGIDDRIKVESDESVALTLVIKNGTIGTASGWSTVVQGYQISSIRLENVELYGSMKGDNGCKVEVLSGQYHANMLGDPVGDWQSQNVTFYGGVFDYNPDNTGAAQYCNCVVAPGYESVAIAGGKYEVRESALQPLVVGDDGFYHIGTVTDLRAFRSMVNGGNNFKGKTVVLDADLDLSDIPDWAPIGVAGNNACTFAGTFDGQEKKIKNLDSGYGLFRSLGQGNESAATIKNLTIQNVTISGNNMPVGAICAGGNLAYGSAATFDNCHVIGNISIAGAWYVGGICGSGCNTFRNCSVEGNEGSIINGDTYVGGIYGWSAEGRFATMQCSVSGVSINGAQAVGGIAGMIMGENSITECSVAEVVISASNDEGAKTTGLIAGWNYGTSGYASYAYNNEVSETTATATYGETTYPTTHLTGLTTDGLGSVVGTDVTFDEDGKIVSGSFEQLVESQVADDSTVTKNDDGTWTVEAKAVCQIGTTTYPTLSAAVAAVPTDGTLTTIKMIANEDMNREKGVSTKVGQNIILDLQTYTISCGVETSAAESYVIDNNGTLVIKGTVLDDGSMGGAIEAYSGGNYWDNVMHPAIQNNGDLTIEDGVAVYNYCEDYSYSGNCVVGLNNKRPSSTVINGGWYISYAMQCIRLYASMTLHDHSSMIINDGYFWSYYDVVKLHGDPYPDNDNKWKGTLEINGGEFEGYSQNYGLGLSVSANERCDIAVKVTGGYFNRGFDSTAGDKAKIEVKDACFTTKEFSYGGESLDFSYMFADGYGLVPNTDPDTKDVYPWAVGEVATDVAAVISADGTTTNKYATLPEALDAATDGQTVQLIADCGLTGTEPYVLKKSIGIDLNGKTLALKRTEGRAVKQMLFIGTDGGTADSNAVTLYTSVKGGKVTFDDKGGNTAGIKPCSATTLTIGRSVGDNPVIIESNKFGIYVADNSHLVVNSADITAQGAPAISTNGSYSPGTDITINGGTFVSNGNLQSAIYNPAGRLVIHGGTFTGDNAVWIRAGSLSIDGGVFTARGPVSGGCDNGDTVVVENCNYPSGVPIVSITGGAFSSVNGGVIGTYHTEGATEDVLHFVKGGVYNKAPAESTVAEGYEVQANAEPFTKDDYPWAVDKKQFVPADPETPITIDITPAGETPAIVPVKVSEDAVTAMVNAGIVKPAGEKATAAEVSEGLAKKQENDQTVWQNYVMGIDGTKAANVIDTIGEKSADKPKEVVVVKTPIQDFNPPQNTGVTVTYNLLRKRPGDTKFSVFQEGLLKPEFDVNTLELDLGDTLWKFEAVFSAAKPK